MFDTNKVRILHHKGSGSQIAGLSKLEAIQIAVLKALHPVLWVLGPKGPT